jgi:hypothetical protein
MLKLNPKRVVEILEQLVQNFMAVFMAQRPDLYLLPFGRYSAIKNGKNRETTNLPPYITSFFSVHRPNKKKLYENVSLVFLYWNPKGFIFIQS